MKLQLALLSAAMALAPLAAEAQSYRCVGKDGKKYYGQSVPQQCIGVLVEQLSPQGTVIRRFDPQAPAADAKKTVEDEGRKKEAAAAKDQSRRDQALLATYSSEKDIEDTRRRAVEGDQKLVTDLEAKIATLKQRRAATKGDAKSLDMEIDVQQNLLATKKKDLATINARYNDEKKRYLELTAKGK